MALNKKGELELRKNDVLFEAGASAEKFYLVKQGLISLSVAASAGPLEIFKAPQNHFVGGEILLGLGKYQTTATALNDSVLIELTADQADVLMMNTTPAIRHVCVGILAKQDEVFKELVTLKREAAETLPCPPDKIAKLFAVIYSVATYIGVKKNDAITVEWNSFRKYSQRVFGESPVRIAQVMWVLVHLKLATMQMIPDETDPEAPEILGYMHFNDLEALKSFSDYCRIRHKRRPGQPEEALHTAILDSIDYWNKIGIPEGAPPPEPISKYSKQD